MVYALNVSCSVTFILELFEKKLHVITGNIRRVFQDLLHIFRTKIYTLCPKMILVAQAIWHRSLGNNLTTVI